MNNNDDDVMFEYTGGDTGKEYRGDWDITHVQCHPSITDISNKAFESCSKLREVVLNEGLQKIGYQAFQNCKSLQSIKLPSTVTEIGDWAFDGCHNLNKVVLNEGLQTLGVHSGSSFRCTSLREIVLPSTVREIYGAFIDCRSMNKVVLNEGLPFIGHKTFQGCTSLESISIPNTVTNIKYGAFNNCQNLRELNLNEGLKDIGILAFEGCSSLQAVSLPSTLTVIRKNAFDRCSSLRVVTLHEGKIDIGGNVFRHCTSLESFKFGHTSARLNNIIQSGHWVGIERKIDDISHVELSGSELLVSAAGIDMASTWWVTVKERLDRVISLITYFEMKEATSLFELALWKAKIDQAEDTDMGGRDACRIEVPGPVKDVIL